MSSSLIPGTNRSGDCGPQLDVLESVLEEAWDKLEQFENKKRSNLIFYGVRGEQRETQADLISKVRKIYLRCLDTLTESDEKQKVTHSLRHF